MPGGRGSAREGRAPRAFTVIELVVAIGAIAILTVGIAAIFNTVGKTVASGRRVSSFTQYAAVAESQMREDFERMTRNGFMVLRHELVDPDNDGETPDLIPLYAGQPVPQQRYRRADELVFFAEGEFRAKREPYAGDLNGSPAPRRVPTANAARIYWGHGVRHDPGVPGFSYRVPGVADGNRVNVPNGQPGPTGGNAKEWLGRDDDDLNASGNDTLPNKYASSWILLRHVTLLTQPGESDLSLDAAYRDTDYQVGYQPAMDHVFHALNPYTTTKAALYPDAPQTARGTITKWSEPDTASGLVEIATTSLPEVRAIVSDVNQIPRAVLTAAAPLPLYDPSDPDESLLDGVIPTISISANGFPQPSAGPPDGQGFNGLDTLNFQHAWMRDAFPSYSVRGSLPLNNRTKSFRMRVEPVPTDLLGAARFSNDSLEHWQAMTDQFMLGSAVLLPGCSEFIVEYSFGNVDPEGRLIWYGQTLPEDQLPPGPTEAPVTWYDMGEYNAQDANGAYYARVVQSFGGVTRPVAPALYMWGNGELIDSRPCEWVMHFGYDDISYVPSSDAQPRALPLAWPKLLRITIALADPREPSIEERFQYVFETPDAAR